MTSYYKLIDWWLAYALYSLVMIMAFHTYLAHVLAKSKGEQLSLQNMISSSKMFYPRQETSKKMTKPLKSAQKLNSVGKMVFAVLMIAFNAIFWTVALREYFKPAKDYL